MTSPRASRFRFETGWSLLGSPLTLILALEAAVAPVARLTMLYVAPLLLAEEEGGFARVFIREGRALAFSASFAVAVRVFRSARRVCLR